MPGDARGLAGLWTLAAAATVAALVWAARPAYLGTRIGRADENYIASKTCQPCHPDHWASWRATFHSRMTQEATPAAVLGDFERFNTFEYLGVRTRMFRRDESYFMQLDHPDGKRQLFPIARTVGSRRIQQYVTRLEANHARLPVAWDVANRRWMSLNGSFFYPDGTNFFQHWALWDANCVFCHNVKAQPNWQRAGNRFNTEVAELGIACGACHGPAAQHAEQAASPVARWRWRLAPDAGTGIVNPSKLPSERSMMICGHCHGQRMPKPLDRIAEILGHGDPYDAGGDLGAWYEPVSHETVMGPVAFATRFWNDGAPRLTAYEYQGVRRSACFERGAPGRRIQCITCHSMHDGDVHGMIKPENRTDRPCLTCHARYAQAAELARHTGHKPELEGARCYGCHMPRVVLGVMSVHRTHEITNPDARKTVALGVPNACSQCHLDRSVNWAIAESNRIWPKRFAAVTPGGPDFDAPEGLRALAVGDALLRSLTAEALPGGVAPERKPWAASLLLKAFEDDYPIVRFFAANGLQSVAPGAAPKPDYLADALNRARQLERWTGAAPGFSTAERLLFDKLRARRANVDIEVGE